MKTQLILLLFATTFIFNSCKLFKKDKEETVAFTDKTEKLIVKKGFTTPANNDPLNSISSINIEGDILSIDVNYNGGCAEHEFKLYFDGNYKKSMPPKVSFILVHDNKDDMCRSILDKTLTFDISEAKYAGQNEIKVSVDGLANEVSYKY